MTHATPTPTSHPHPPTVFGNCQSLAEELLYACTDNEKKECARDKACAWNADAGECTAKQAPLLEALLGEGHAAAAAARGCHEHAAPDACAAAGEVEYDAAADGRGLFVTVPEPAAA
jgi:hypothetical protein